jgi:hypothetical protein
MAKKSKTNDFENFSTPPDFIDNLLRYLDERSRQESFKNNEIKKTKSKDSIL